MFSVINSTRVRLRRLHLVWAQLIVEDRRDDVRSPRSISYVQLRGFMLRYRSLRWMYHASMSPGPCGVPLLFYPSFVDVLTFGPRSVLKRSGLLVPIKYLQGSKTLSAKLVK